MAETAENLIFEYLPRLEVKMDRVVDHLGDLKVGVTNLEEGLAGVTEDLTALKCASTASSGVSVSLNRRVEETV